MRPGVTAAIWLCLTTGAAGGPALAGQQPSLSVRIAAAVAPLPVTLRTGAGVVVIDSSGQSIMLRPTANGVICIGDKPGDAWFEVECYHRAFMPVIYRQRELAATGLSAGEVDRRIEAEIHQGRLRLAAQPTMNYQLFGPISGYDTTTNTMSSAISRTERLFVPWGTPATTGVPGEADRLYPWLMDAGTYFAHVMIVPERGDPSQPLEQ